MDNIKDVLYYFKESEMNEFNVMSLLSLCVMIYTVVFNNTKQIYREEVDEIVPNPKY